MTRAETIPAVTVERLVRAAIAYFDGLTVEDVMGRNQTQAATAARAAVAYTLREAGWSLSAIGRALDNRDFSTIHHLVKRHKEGAYPSYPIPATVSAPRDLGGLITRVAELEATVETLRAEIEAISRSFVRRAR